MKKIVALLLTVSMVAGIAVGCKKSESTQESTTESMATDESIEVTTSETTAESSAEPEGTKPPEDPDAGTRATDEVADGNYMMDEAFKKGIIVDIDRLSSLLGIPVVGVVAKYPPP